MLTWANVGVMGFIPKPLSMQDLLKAIHKSSSQLYSIAQKSQQANSLKQLKEQKQQMQEHYEHNEIKLNETIAYERKRLGRLLLKERELQKQLEDQGKRLEKFRFKDDLTGLDNKHALKEEISKQGDKALLFIDIDHFESINTLYGMGYGNKVLKETAKRLERFLPSNAKLFRISADEFVVLIFSPTPDQELFLSQQVLAMFKQAPVVIGEVEFLVVYPAG